ncbi:hypothetical protein PPYR_13303 [Photinus pyralis]|uniref:BHLH domain-containing protein n=1 Tax=Photinus pyralis TaxID=7054 RepID=A0A5N4A8N4_PHOPY|nr:T-cell acute lymphocytic leukemia protein 1 isoform X1 [Photinus pyralis]KAB0793683.1 hypothetical protein PPYR_13303 [Photinus pyralis]
MNERAYIFKFKFKIRVIWDFVMTAKGRDFELYSGGEEDEYLEVEVHSPTDSSEDSVEVKVSPICLRNKRKCAEPRKVQDAYTAPLKKRMCLQAKNEFASGNEPFRPWNAENSTTSSAPKQNLSKDLRVPSSITTDIKLATPDSNFVVPRPPDSDDKLLIRPCSSASPKNAQPALVPLSLVKKATNSSARSRKTKPEYSSIKTECEIPAPCDPLTLRVPLHPRISSLNATETEQYLANSAEAFPNLQSHRDEDHTAYGRKEQRNYKNMTRERRIEANARERTRVHTISAAFETLRKAVPAYSHNQKLSKLSVLRIACSYIMTLGKLAGNTVDSESGGSQSLAECVDTVSKTIQKEGKLRKKKDEID